MNTGNKSSIRKTQDKKIKSKKSGFTLIELLVSIGIVITSATIVVAVITATFRGSSKTNTGEQVRDAGNSAISQLSTIVQYADSFSGAIKGGVNLTVCNPSSGNTSVDSVKISKNGSIRTITCTSNDLSLDGKTMFNRGKYSMTNCSITCSQTGITEPPVIGIKFKLSAASIGFSENSSSLNFSKTIKMVNLNQ